MQNYKKKIYHEVDSLSLDEKKRAQIKVRKKAEDKKKYSLSFLPLEEELRNFVRFHRPQWENSTSDNDLMHFICEKMYEAKFLYQNNIKISIGEGVVEIEGNVIHKECKKIIQELILSIPGVVRVVNKLEIVEY